MLNQKFFNGVGNYLRAEVLYRLGIRPFEKARTILEALAETKVGEGENKSQAGKTRTTKDIADEESPYFQTQENSGKTQLKAETASPLKIETKTENGIHDVKPDVSAMSGRACDGSQYIPPEDLLGVTHRLAKEVVGLGFDGGYFSETRDKWESGFGQWLRCYFKEGMSSVKDHNGRTMWFQGEAGPMAPAGIKRGGGSGGKGKAKKAEVKEEGGETPPKKARKKGGKAEVGEGETKTAKAEKKPKTEKKAKPEKKANADVQVKTEKNEKENVGIAGRCRPVKAETGTRRSQRVSKANL